MALICFDFDETLVRGHYHSIFKKYNIDPKSDALKYINLKKLDPLKPTYNYIEEILESLLNDQDTEIRCPLELKEIFETLNKNGHKIAITSFSDYPEVIKFILKKIGLSEAYLNEIKIIIAPEDKNQNKNRQLEAAMIEFDISDPKEVFLIDDNHINCEDAAEKGYNSILINCDKDLGSVLERICQQKIISSDDINLENEDRLASNHKNEFINEQSLLSESIKKLSISFINDLVETRTEIESQKNWVDKCVNNKGRSYSI